MCECFAGRSIIVSTSTGRQIIDADSFADRPAGLAASPTQQQQQSRTGEMTSDAAPRPPPHFKIKAFRQVLK